MKFDDSGLDEALGMLDGRLRLNDSPSVRLVVCGGSALIAMDIVYRTTRDVDDLEALKPTSAEIRNAARWCIECDPSEGFKQILVSMLQQLGYSDVAARL